MNDRNNSHNDNNRSTSGNKEATERRLTMGSAYELPLTMLEAPISITRSV